MMAHSTFGSGVIAGLTAAGAAVAALLILRRRDARGTSSSRPDTPFADRVDEEMAESFPASDPPSHAATLGATPTT
jgi:hypothetical protein